MIVRKRKQCELWEAKGEMDFGRFSIAPTIRFDCSGCLTQFAMDNGTSKRSTYAQSACGQCKRRKAKCSGGSPCTACVKFREECVYATQKDGRKLASVAYVSSLEQRLEQLEDELETRSSSAASLDDRVQAYQSRLLALERGLSARGISVSEVLEEGRASQPIAITPSASSRPRLEATTARRPSVLGKRASTHDVLEDEEDEESGWVEGMRALQLDNSQSLRYHGPSSALLHTDADTPSSPPQSAPISASLDFSPSPFATASSLPPYDPFSSDFLTGRTDEIDWSRNLPAQLGLDRTTHDHLLDLFEAFFAPWCLVVDMPSFRRDLARCLSPSASPSPSRTDFYSPMLHNAILALACSLYRGPRIVKPFPPINPNAPALQLFPQGPSTFFSESEQSTLDSSELAGLAFYNQARASLESECENPMLSSVRALICFASFQSNLARCNLGYLYFGIALRCATALGLNIATDSFVESGVITNEVRLARNSVFHTVFQQDSLWSLALGRFVTYRNEDHEIPLPTVDSAVDAQPWLVPTIWQHTDPSAENGSSPRHLQPHGNMAGLVSTTFVATAKLALIQSELIKELYHFKHTPGSTAHLAAVTSINVRLERLAADLPSELKIGHFLASPPPPHVLTLNLMIQKVIMLLHRPSFHRPNDEGADQSIRRCNEAANKVLRLVELYDSTYCIAYGPLSNVQTIFIAGTVFLLSAKRSHRAAKRLKTSLDGAEACCGYLLTMSQTWKWARKTHEILRGLVRRWNAGSPSPSPAANNDPTTSSNLPAVAPFPAQPEFLSFQPAPPFHPPPSSDFGANPYSTIPFLNHHHLYTASASVPPPLPQQNLFDPSAHFAHPQVGAFGTELGFDFDFMGVDPFFGASAGGWSGGGVTGEETVAYPGFGGAEPWRAEEAGAEGASASTTLPQPEGVEPYVP